jgi:AsmA protein
MSRTARVILIIIGVLIVLVIIAPFLIPVNEFRPTIEQKASTALGRKVDLGNLSLSLLSGSLTADNLSVADDPKFNSSPFLTAKSIKVGVELIPLITSKQLNITGITIDNPEVTLIRDPKGEWNYSSFGTSGAKGGENAPSGAKSEEKQAPSARKEPAGKPEPKPAESAPPQESSKSASNELSIQKFNLNNGRISIGSTTSQKRSVYDKVDVSASNVSLATRFPVSLTANLPGGGNLKLEGNVGPVDQSNSALTPVDAKLTINSLNLATAEILDPSLGLGGLLDLSASLASQNGTANLSGNAKLSRALLVQGGTPASIPVSVDFRTKYDLRKNTGVLDPSTLKIGNAAAHLQGTYEVPAEGAVLHIKMTGENLPAKDLETFLPAVGVNLPSGATLQTGTMNLNLQMNGPTNKLVTTGNAGLFNAKLAGFDLGSKMAAISSLAGIKTGSDLEIEKLTTDASLSPTGTQIQNFDAVLPQLGTLVGNGTIDAKNELDLKMAATVTHALGGVASAAGNAAGGAASNALGGLLGKVTGGASSPLGNCKSTGGGGPTIPFQVKGTTKDPKFVPDVGGVAASMLKSQLGCFGGGQKSSQQQPGQKAPSNPADAIRGLFKKKP